MHQLHPKFRTWYITWGTHAARLHGSDRLTVDKRNNQPGDDFIRKNELREQFEREQMHSDPVRLTQSQRLFIEEITPSICVRGGWELRTCAAGPDHVHVLLDVDPSVHGEKVRRLLKRWIGQEMSTRWTLDGPSWWAEEGSTKPVYDHAYLNEVFPYVFDQRTTPAVKV